MTPGVVYLAGVGWDGAAGTDRRLATALAAYRPVLWVDPPDSALRDRFAYLGARVDVVAPNVRRLRTVGPPGVTRIGMRWVADRLVARAVRRTVGVDQPVAVVVANPLLGFPAKVPGARLFYVTDDWVAGADLMGLSAAHLARVEARNAQAADAVLAVSPALAEMLTARTGALVEVLANGCTVPTFPLERRASGPRPVAGLVGQLNERLDLELLEGVSDREVDLLVVGPRRDRDGDFSLRLDALLARPNVQWVGEQAAEDLPEHLAQMRVGLTPYAPSAFNRASFPLKTLDYLAAGLACVATPGPALDWLDTDLVIQAEGRQAYSDAVVTAAYRDEAPEEPSRRRDLARRHTWDMRARQLLGAASVPSDDLSDTHNNVDLIDTDNDNPVGAVLPVSTRGGTL